MSDLSQGTAVVRVERLDHPSDVSRFLRGVRAVVADGFRKVHVDVSGVGRVFPNACVPISAIIHHYRGIGLELSLVGQPRMVGIIRLDAPLFASPDNLKQVDPLSRVWSFSDEMMVSGLVTSLVRAVVERVECEPGVALAFEWCLNEVMDNVLQHSQACAGYAMVQVHPGSKRLAICIADTGLGIYGTLRHSAHRPRRALDALTLAIREGITRDKEIGQGNGLWGLLEIVKRNTGQLSITSGEGSLFLRGNEVHTFDYLPIIDARHRGTIIDFQLDAGRVIDLAAALK